MVGTERIRRLKPTGTRWNTFARRVFLVAGFMVLSGIALGVTAMLLGLESIEWAFVIIFWFGILLSVPALAAVLLTGGSASDNRKFRE
jgi:hypothetical protein